MQKPLISRNTKQTVQASQDVYLFSQSLKAHVKDDRTRTCIMFFLQDSYTAHAKLTVKMYCSTGSQRRWSLF